MSFVFEITSLLKEGINDLVVLAVDDVRSEVQPAGKQSQTYYNSGCFKYTRTTGIWQTVWLESRPESCLKRVRIVPDPDNNRFVVTPEIENFTEGMTLTTRINSPEGRKVLTLETKVTDGVPFDLKLKDPHPWSPGDPYLYSLEFILESNGSSDVVKSYAGLRKFHIDGNRIYLNNQPVFLRFVLDQGYYPGGILTAPSDEALKKDIELS